MVALSACADEPQYAVRPGEPRAVLEMPKPAYPIRPEAAPTAPTAAQAPAPPPATPLPADAAPPPFKPVPIPEAAPSLRGRQSPGPSTPRAAPVPALETPAEVVVLPGESLFEVAERMRTPIQAIIEANGLKPPYDVTPGQTLKIPPPVVYTVKAGDTFLSIGRRFSIDPRSLANLNDIPLETPLRPGQRLALPSLVSDRSAKRTLPARTATLTGQFGIKPLKITPTAPIAPTAAPVPRSDAVAENRPETPSTGDAASAAKGKFVWPVKGDILSTFGPKGPGQRNDGVNIAAAAGDPVRAAAAGTVVYAGNSVPGFGNLVVVKHPGGWTSLYGNLGKMTVKIRSEVAQGDPLGVAGQSGAVDRPQVHFEVRFAETPQEKAKPIDPQGVLP